MNSFKQILSKATDILTKNNLTNCYNEALILLAFAANSTKEKIIANLDIEASSETANNYFDYIERRVKFEPIAYILEKKEFWSLDFKVSPSTLIPRGDSEILVESVLKYCKKNQELNILDLGTGSGCLILSIISELPKAQGTGVDISGQAIEIAKYNAKNLGFSDRMKFINSSWKDFEEKNYDIIISNPPYITKEEIPNLQQDVQFEPITALDGGDDGLDSYKEIISLLPIFSKTNTLVFFEIGYGQSEDICALLEAANFKVLKIENDLSNIPRVIIFTHL